MIKKSYELIGMVDYNKIVEIRQGQCYCLSLSSDLETYLEIEGHEDNCVDEFIICLRDYGLVMNEIVLSDKRNCR